MASSRSVDRKPVSVAEAHLARVSGSGCARHPHLHALVEGSGPHSGRDLADAVHLLCGLHGRHPGLIEIALTQTAESPVRPWLAQASEAFERERLYLVRLTSAVGPLPSTPGAAETEASLLAQRHALEILASSERTGCALGAATALVGDWWPIRRLLDRAAVRAGLDCPSPSLPDEASLTEVIDLSSDNPASGRALAFGGEQLLLQHRALFDLLEARASARVDWDG
jgi:transposase